MVQLSHAYMTTGKTIALTRWMFVGKVMSLLFNMLSRFVIAFLPKSKHLLISSLYSSYLLVSSASVTSIPFLSFILPIFAWIFPLVSLIFIKVSLVFHILFFPSISLHCLLRKAFLSLLVILWNSAFRWGYLSFSPLPFISLFSAMCKASSDNHFAF